MKRNIENKKETLVYQYLPYSKFELMINNRTIRLGNIRKSNDSSELELRKEIFKEVIVEEYNNKKPKYMNIESDVFCDLFSNKIEYINQNEDNLHTEFVSCFSGESDLLSQWRGYAQEICINKHTIQNLLKNNKNEKILLNDFGIIGGVAVGFDVKQLNRITSNKTGLGDTFSFGKVAYSKYKQKALFREDAREIVKEIRRYVKENKSLEQFNWSVCQLIYHKSIISKGAYIKNSFFFEEKEYRICFWDSLSLNNKEIKIGKTAILSCKEYIDNYKKNNISNLHISPQDKYYYIYMNNDMKNYIKEIVIGPNCMHTEKEIKSFLISNGIDCKIRKSRGDGIFVSSSNHKNSN